jgi:UDP-3-O-[3-hydroxymyristoyl] N-acetylglucosamine deacetylase
MAALVMLGIDNASVETGRPETPIMDGSAAPFSASWTAPACGRSSGAPIHRDPGDRRGRSTATSARTLEPADGFEVAVRDRLRHRRHRSRQRIDHGDGRVGVPAPSSPTAAHFGFACTKWTRCARMGLARGGSLENCVVIDGDRLLNPEGLRARGRVRAPQGAGRDRRPLRAGRARSSGRFEGVLAGHGINNALVRALAGQADAPGATAPSPRTARGV